MSDSIESVQQRGEINVAYLIINGEKIEGSRHYTYYGGSEGHVSSLGSRSLYMRLEAGDTISIRTTSDINALYRITLCFELVQFDYLTSI